MSAFTPEAVRDTLIAAGFTEYGPDTDLAGFYVKPYPSTIFVTWDPGCLVSVPADQQESIHGHYRDTLRQAGYRVGVQAGCVPVTGVREEAQS